MSIILILLLKILIHFYFFTEIDLEMANLNVNAILEGKPKLFLNTNKSFYYHVENIFNKGILLFIPSILLILFLIWFFNDKIKAR
jgi:hypothetical protein